ncbi:glutamate receptor ionotropic, kainate 2-like isoform X1 [Ischnura elegans]|uniref:glutamate receptor ionotropic, kainate 2-like isoform X1 n=1 Tax=Ischnura elegans TaxID=197161 RepID=UPI001ED86DB5|nr:glutamate receptor ionotropic, kainate 2-like isoform X1 [Ischnura elegans]
MELLSLLYFLSCTIVLASGQNDYVQIGGIFGPDDHDLEVAFRYAVDRINMDRILFPHGGLKPLIEKVSPYDSFQTSKRVCNITQLGVAAIFGPSSRLTSNIVQSTCDTLEIPHLETRWDPKPHPRSCLINLHPYPQSYSRAIKDLLKEMQWKSFTIIYETNEGLVRLQEVLKSHGPSEYPITVRQLGEGHDHRPLLKQIQASSESHILLDCSVEKILEVLTQAKEVKMMEDYQSYVITNLDLHTVDMEEFRFGRTNITGFRMVDPQSKSIQNAVNDWQFGEMRSGRRINITANTVKTETALMYDAVRLFARAFVEMNRSSPINTTHLSCDDPGKWEPGYKLINYMKFMELSGLTGYVRFDVDGRRVDFPLDIIELDRNGFVKTGLWDYRTGINYTRTEDEKLSIISESLQNKTFVVSSRLGAPFLMEREPKGAYTGNERYEGYSMDLIDEVSKILGFKYVFELVPDGRYGSLDPKTKKWDGLVKQLLEKKADLAICDLTITYSREQAVDFTMPFMNLGISILYSKPVKQPPNLFSFLSPLSVDVWIYMATAYLGVSVVLFVLARLTPYEWNNPHPCNPDPEELETQFNLLNCMWFAIGSLMQQGCDFLPKAVSTRMVAGMWWFFTLIMISSYTANLAAFLTVERMDVTIESAEDLAKQTKIKYGAVEGGSTASFFKESNFSTYQRMWSFMESARPPVFAKSNSEGVERVSKGKRGYAFLMESTSIEYVVERQCDLTQVGGLLDSKGYGIALPLNSPYRTAVSGAVLKLQEGGKLHMLKTRWWKEKHGGGSCKEEKSSATESANELGLANVGGVFVVLISGMGAAAIVAVLEFLWNTKKVAVEERATFKSALQEELRFVLKCHGSTKPVRKGNAKEDSGGKSGGTGGGNSQGPYDKYGNVNKSNKSMVISPDELPSKK